ncbi:unnamed protein product [Closterium sp. Naga37s-1]|nr:unnamed protein product [Closterium sp. Naga37s-1]
MATASATFKSREDHRKQQELEEARKAGLAPAELDEDGNEINPHIPQYMSSAPWYLNAERPSLKHQRNWKGEGNYTNLWYDRGAKGFQAEKYRKGACTNCGAMTHTAKLCVERPRKVGAKWTSQSIAPDEKIQSIELNYEGKRDRWNGFDAATYKRTMDSYDIRAEARKKFQKEQQLKKLAGKGGDGEGGGKEGGGKEGEGGEGGEDEEEEEEEDDAKVDESRQMDFGKVEKRVRTTGGGSTGSVRYVMVWEGVGRCKGVEKRVRKRMMRRNLRIHEDTAKYLLNLDVDSAYYDPKTRSMREDPNPEGDAKDKFYLGDNHNRISGQALENLRIREDTAKYLLNLDVHSLPSPYFRPLSLPPLRPCPNLRIREDTAKYLLNLDVDSAYYDPKTRSMREDPNPEGDAKDKFYLGDNHNRISGQALEFRQLTVHAWEAMEKVNVDVHLQGAPSQAELLHREFKVKKEKLKGASKESVLAKYGNAASNKGRGVGGEGEEEEGIPEELLLGQTEVQVEYDRAGRPLRGVDKAVPCSRYEEDVLVNNHTAVWGSWWGGGVWGYACCHQTTRMSYCTGASGIAAAEASANLMQANMERREQMKAAKEAGEREEEDEEGAGKAKQIEEKKGVAWGTDADMDIKLDKKKLRAALKREDELAREEKDERKRKYNVTYSDDVTEEDMEAYRMKRIHADDPMLMPHPAFSSYFLPNPAFPSLLAPTCR